MEGYFINNYMIQMLLRYRINLIQLQFRGRKVHIRDMILKNGNESTKVKLNRKRKSI